MADNDSDTEIKSIPGTPIRARHEVLVCESMTRLGNIPRIRISGYKILLHDSLTPLLRKEILNLIQLNSEVLELPSPVGRERDRVLNKQKGLKTAENRLMEHWARVHGNICDRSRLISLISLLQQFLPNQLLEEYTGQKCHKGDAIPDWVLIQVDRIKKHYSSEDATDYNERQYQMFITFPVEEMILDRDHVEKKLRAAASGERYPGGIIQHLIKECDWPTLATTLASDRKMLHGLNNQMEIFAPASQISRETCNKVLQCINRVQNKYFAKLPASAPCMFIKSVYAVKEEAKRTSSKGRHTEDAPGTMKLQGLCHKITNALRLKRSVPQEPITRKDVSESSSFLDPETKSSDLTEKVG